MVVFVAKDNAICAVWDESKGIPFRWENYDTNNIGMLWNKDVLDKVSALSLVTESSKPLRFELNVSFLLFNEM